MEGVLSCELVVGESHDKAFCHKVCLQLVHVAERFPSLEKGSEREFKARCKKRKTDPEERNLLF